MVALDELVSVIGTDPERLHGAYLAEMAKDEHHRHGGLVNELRRLLGAWPYPDTPPEQVLAFVGRPGCPPLTVLIDREASRPERYRRPALVAALRERAAEVGQAHAAALGSAWPRPAVVTGGLFRAR
ncbi:hypothetical protein [Parafrankia sp. BMG5.11]|uniref:hypothetical protein n=1 Tax=Parafrankia sp. BMG5.11 TaxID=222540 RepID=UPI00103E4A04|nr:hypothetical protein [Parafrankia sp. BMG5.11]TCJ36868.1 hypothetical protein E0504_21565 [Parafrankia sp. BMG5.11]